MSIARPWPVALLLVSCTAVVSAQFAPPASVPPDKEKRDLIAERTAKLGTALERLRKLNVRDPGLAEVEVYHRAAEMIVRHEEFYGKQSADQTLSVLDRGLLRAAQLGRGETPWWGQTGQSVVRAYRSRLDGTVQPYAITFPADYATDKRKRYRLDVVLHGRDASLTEVKFLHQHSGDRPAPKDQTWVQLDIFGRGNNAYRWAGEVDVNEAVEHFLAVEAVLERSAFLDPTRVVLRGFSMGGAGTWHLGLHRPSAYCVLGPGAGFTTTHGYIKDLGKLPAWQEACLRIYDAVDYAENVANVPVVAYSGDKDPQMDAATQIEKRLAGTGLAITHLVAPGLAHAFPGEWQKKAQAEYAKYAQAGRPEYPARVRFVTWTLKYNQCAWVDVLGLEKHYAKAVVDAKREGDDGFSVKTENVRALHLSLWPGADRGPLVVQIDGQKLEKVKPYLARAGDLHVYLEKRGGAWRDVLPERLFIDRQRKPQKSPGLQGPIDDAFTGPFLCVRGTGTAWNAAAKKHAEAELERFKAEWSKFFRGELPVKDDSEVTADDIAGRHLILFGDPGSNSLLAQALPGLPLAWTEKEVTLAGQTVSAADHVPALIYPSPLAADRYVVVNSGHTFGAKDLRGTNALLFPKLGDYALLEVGGDAAKVVAGGLFDEGWAVGK